MPSSGLRKSSRTANAVRNIVWGVLGKLLGVVLPFATRTVLIYTLGAEYLGLNSLFTSVLQVLSLAELGFGSAIAFSMYEPIERGDVERLCALSRMLRGIYRIVGAVILALGLALVPLLDRLVTGDVPADVNMYVLYGVYLFNTVVSYFLFAYKNTLFSAFQRNDVNSKVAMAVSVVDNVAKVALLLLTRSYYLYVLVIPAMTILTNLATGALSRRAFPKVKCEGRLSKDEKRPIYKRMVGLVSYKVYGVVFSAVDSVVISAFLGLVPLAVFSNYYYVQSAVAGFMSVLMASITASVGSKMVTHSLDENYADFRKFVFLNGWLCAACAVCMACMYQPFMVTWLGEDLLLPTHTMLLMVLYFFLPRVTTVTYTYREAAGLWWEDRLRPLVATVVNVALNLVLVQVVGLDGVILSTLFCTVFINVPWGALILHRSYFKRATWPYLLQVSWYAVATAAACLVCWAACFMLPDVGWGWLALRCVVCLVLGNAVLALCLCKTPEFKPGVGFAVGVVRGFVGGRGRDGRG